MLNMMLLLLIAIISVNASNEHILFEDNAYGQFTIEIPYQNHQANQNNAIQIPLINTLNENEMVQNNSQNPIAPNQIMIIQDTGAYHERQKYYSTLISILNDVLAIPNWVIPSLLTLDKAIPMAILQFGLRIPRDVCRGASIVNFFVSLGITVANAILLRQAIEDKGTTIPDAKHFLFVTAVPIGLDLLRWRRWKSELQNSKAHFLDAEPETGEDEHVCIHLTMVATNYFMPIVLQPYYSIILYFFGWLSWIRKIERETVLLLFIANVTARCIAYNPNPYIAQYVIILGPFIVWVLWFIFHCITHG